MNVLPQRQVHLDFHTSECIEGIGSKFDKKQFQDCLKKGHVNSITVFAKCHHGWAYFPSETNEMHPHLNFDLLSAMLEACREIGVATPVYISAGLDQNYAVKHPEDTALDRPDQEYPTILEEENGHKYVENHAGWKRICFNSPYLDVLASQVKEVMEKFNPEAIFLDIVGPRPCYCNHCKKIIADMGLDVDNPKNFDLIIEDTYKKYYEKINSTARAVNPDVRIFHNAGHIMAGRRDLAHANTHLELESLPTGGWGYDHFPKSAKYVALLGMDYLGMTGKFHTSWGEFGGFKHPNALKYEVALSLANGAKCSVGDQMHPYGFLDEGTYELIGIAYAEAEKVEEYCYDVTPLADIGILSIESLFGAPQKNSLSDVGACRMMLEGKYLYDVVDAECDFSKYKLLILPDVVEISGEVGEKIKAYVKNGGKVLCTGKSGLDEKGGFAFDLGVKYEGVSKYNPTYFRPEYKAMGIASTSYLINGQMHNVALCDNNASVLGYGRNPFFNREPQHFCSHKNTPFETEDNSPACVVGKDGGYIAWDVFKSYAEIGSYILKDIVLNTVDAILGEEKTLKTNLPSFGVVTLNDQTCSSRLVLHSLYATPVTRGKGIQIIEDLVPVYNTKFEIKTDKKIKSVTLVPQNKKLDFEQKNGKVCFTIDEFTCSQIAVLDY